MREALVEIIIITLCLVVIVVYFWWRFYFFFRDPERDAPEGRDILAPADGKIVYIKKVTKNIIPMSIKEGKKIQINEITKMSQLNDEEKFIIGIFMFPWSVHVNRAPIEGVIGETFHFKNKNRPMTLMWMKSLFNIRPYYKKCYHVLENERKTTVIKGPLEVIVVQIADIYVNKILSWVKPDQRVAKGQRIGMIKMGSQVDCIFPADKVMIRVKEGQHVKAGETILATY